MDNYFILENLTDDTELPDHPSEYYIMYLYFITIKPEDKDDYFLILEYPSYSMVKTGDIYNDCIWSTPYMAYQIQQENLRWIKNVGKIKKFFSNKIENEKELLNTLSRHRLYHVGLQDYELKDGSHYIEFKKSERHKGVWKCYYIQEYFVSEIDPVGLINLVDPEGLHGYRYFPIKEFNDEGIVRFDGKHLATNVANILKPCKYQNLQKYAITVQAKSLRYKQNGALLKLDISGFTRLYNSVKNKTWTFSRSGDEIADEFIYLLAMIFEHELRKNNITQYRIEGDGFVATIPYDILNKETEREILKNIQSLICDIYRRVNSLFCNAKGMTEITMRYSLMKGDYYYGRVAGLFSLQQNHAGENLINLTRMDEYMKKKIESDDSPKTTIFSCITKEYYNNYNELWNNNKYKKMSEEENFRDTTISAILLRHIL